MTLHIDNARPMNRQVRVRLGENVHSFGEATIPDDRIVELSEDEAAAILRHRVTRNSVEVLGWVDDRSEEERPPA